MHPDVPGMHPDAPRNVGCNKLDTSWTHSFLIHLEHWDLRFRFRSPERSASLLREYATPTLTPTNNFHAK